MVHIRIWYDHTHMHMVHEIAPYTYMVQNTSLMHGIEQQHNGIH